MMLITRCPYCQTTFRVVQDQLKIYNGVVRCGACQQIFNGVEQLIEQPAAMPPTPEQAKPEWPEVDGDDATTIKRAYRKLMSEHHPDKLVAKGLPPEMMEMAKQKAQEIQKAYELIKEQKGFK